MNKGGFIGKSATPTRGYAGGIWNLNEQGLSQTSSIWPSRNPNISTTNLLCYFDAGYLASYGGSGTIWTDLSGNDNTGNLVNTPAHTPGTAGYFSFIEASSQEVTTTNSISRPAAHTMFVLFRTSTASGRKLIGFETNQTGISSGYDPHVYVGTDGRIKFGVWNGSTAVIASTTAVVTDNIWRMVITTFGGEGNTMRVYINGSSDTTASTTQTAPYTSYIRIAGRTISGWSGGGNGTYTGDIAAVGAYSRAFNATEVYDLYNAYKPYYPGL